MPGAFGLAKLLEGDAKKPQSGSPIPRRRSLAELTAIWTWSSWVAAAQSAPDLRSGHPV
jgi:hypothetical protein